MASKKEREESITIIMADCERIRAATEKFLAQLRQLAESAKGYRQFLGNYKGHLNRLSDEDKRKNKALIANVQWYYEFMERESDGRATGSLESFAVQIEAKLGQYVEHIRNLKTEGGNYVKSEKVKPTVEARLRLVARTEKELDNLVARAEGKIQVFTDVNERLFKSGLLQAIEQRVGELVSKPEEKKGTGSYDEAIHGLDF